MLRWPILFLLNLKSLPEIEIIVAYRRLVIPYHQILFDSMTEMDQELDRIGCIFSDPNYCFNIYHDGEYKEENIDVEICETVIEAKEGNKLLNFKVLPAIDEAVCVLHKGPYTSLGEAYGAAFENGLRIMAIP
ncbi:GyrI-like domain-containing protein [endosymbiont 'TC1' of Trimyema compressum]|uniref:GyrI-like domain-containing protein n=1 Tax=endosymbiont 'TC1' of Trimyema compressum TaxID=243899 RepID=UPI000AEE5A9D|nr:GyrI-like domain-containing protein [endosymbiont 'TC1' of Trimyema compressum]